MTRDGEITYWRHKPARVWTRVRPRAWTRERQHRPFWSALGALIGLALLSLTACAPFADQTLRPATASLAPPPLPPRASMGSYDPRLAAVNARIAHMTLDQELGQLFVVEYLYPDANHDDLKNMITRMGAGAVILYASMNIYTIPQTRALTHALQAAAPIPLIIGADEEGGGDDQTNQIFGSHPSESDIGGTGDPRDAAREATRIAKELRELGLNATYAPVVDVEAPWRRWLRSFGNSPAMVSAMSVAQVDALQRLDVMACPKHFPGLGAATVNPHVGLPVIDSSRAYIEANDFAPYRALVSHHPAMIMTTDLLMPAIDPTMPAELSYPIVTGILRKELGYDGVVVTDALYMGGITDKFSIPQAGVLAIQAGNDMLEGAWDTDTMSAMMDALRAAVAAGQITRARIDESVRRILLLKMRFGLLPPPRAITSHVRALAAVAPVGSGNAAGSALDALVPDPRRQL